MYIDESYARLRGRLYKRILLRDSYREDGKVKKRAVGNLSHCSEQEIAAIKFGLAHKDNIKDMVSEKELPEKVKTKKGLSRGEISLYSCNNQSVNTNINKVGSNSNGVV